MKNQTLFWESEPFKLSVAEYLTRSAFKSTPIVLEIPDTDSIESLYDKGCAQEIWRFSRYPKTSSSVFRQYFDRALARRDSLSFVIREQKEGKIAGFTRLKSIGKMRGAETGTWFLPQYQNKHLNFFAKKILLGIAFDLLELSNVYCYVSQENIPSIKSLKNMGFVSQEGYSREKRCADGRAQAQEFLLFDSANYLSVFG
ncbi:GNAT family N-acetyltransferase [Aliikangiella sp. G2MR2-5]|uniref:GNAT family N-acetyltransferase n=1 Tax=Aliikangiella sp. G2MR2-5 TaxID=2788943 RepID=UPI0018AA0826|nr:GNAT family N-acetyltransferase [Aliikangiella sp. G2MR2-5]